MVQAVLSGDRATARAHATAYAVARDHLMTWCESQAAADAILEAIHHPARPQFRLVSEFGSPGANLRA